MIFQQDHLEDVGNPGLEGLQGPDQNFSATDFGQNVVHDAGLCPNLQLESEVLRIARLDLDGDVPENLLKNPNGQEAEPAARGIRPSPVLASVYPGLRKGSKSDKGLFGVIGDSISRVGAISRRKDMSDPSTGKPSFALLKDKQVADKEIPIGQNPRSYTAR